MWYDGRIQAGKIQNGIGLSYFSLITFISGCSLLISRYVSTTSLMPACGKTNTWCPLLFWLFIVTNSRTVLQISWRKYMAAPLQRSTQAARWSQSAVWFSHSLACQALVVLSVELMGPQPVRWRVLVRIDGAIPCCRSNLAHKWYSLSEVFHLLSPHSDWAINESSIICQTSWGWRRRGTKSSPTARARRYQMVLEQGHVHWPYAALVRWRPSQTQEPSLHHSPNLNVTVRWAFYHYRTRQPWVRWW